MSVKRTRNYRAMFFIGIAFLAAGGALSASIGVGMGVGLTGLGVAFVVIGVKNRSKWKV